MVEPGALVDLNVQAHELLFHNVQSLLSAEIRNRAPAQSHPFRKDVFWRFDVLGCGDLKNWMVRVDASYYSKHK
jgi:hypothetical protein